MTTYAIIYDTTTGIGYGSHAYGDSDPVLPSNEIACTPAQAQTPAAWTVVNGSLVQSLTYAQAVQSALIKQGFANAVAAIPFTINGVNYTLDTAQTKQAADMAIVVAANNAMNHPVLWAASTPVAQYAIQSFSLPNNGLYGTHGSSCRDLRQKVQFLVLLIVDIHLYLLEDGD